MEQYCGQPRPHILTTLDVVNVERNQSDGSTTACHFEACLAGDKVTSVDVVLERLSDKMTRVSVTARKGWASPQLETAGEILASIVAAARRRRRHSGNVPAVLFLLAAARKLPCRPNSRPANSWLVERIVTC